MSKKEALVESIGLRYIDPNEIEKNPDNPRLIFEPQDLEALKESIKESGILVPLLVYLRNKDRRYVILDGQRRWMCALKLGLETVPANVIAEPSQITNILTMFNIHNVRTAWEPLPTALKLEVLIRLLKIKKPRTNPNLNKLAQLTGMSPTNVEHTLRLLSYPKRYQDLMLAGDKEERIKADFFVELYPVLNLIEKTLPEISNEYPRDKIVDRLLEKYKSGVIGSAREFRLMADMIRAIKRGFNRESVISQIKSLVSDPKKTVRQTYEESSKLFYDLESFEESALDLRHYLTTIDPADLLPNEQLIKTLENIKQLLDDLLSQIHGRIKS